MRRIIGLLIVFHSTASAALAQVPERVRLDVLVAGATSLRAFAPPSRLTAGDPAPSDALAIVQPTLFVSVTPRVQAGIDLPVAVAFNPAGPQVGLPRGRNGLGDVRLFATAVAVAERRWTPSVQTVVSGSIETATLPHLAAPSGMGGRLIMYKTPHPRFRVAGSVGYSNHLQEPARVALEPFRTWGGMIELGVTRRSLMTVSIEEVVGGLRRAGSLSPTSNRDLQASLSLTRYDKARPRVALVVNAYGLGRSHPFIMAGVRFAVLSVGQPAW